MKSIDAGCTVDRNISFFPCLDGKIETTLKDKGVLKCCALPPFRHAMGDVGVFVAGEAEAGEPLAVKLPRCLLQQRYPPLVVLDQGVVGGEDVSNAVLNLDWWKSDRKGFQ